MGYTWLGAIKIKDGVHVCVSPIKRKKLFLGDVLSLNRLLSLVSTTKYRKFECRIGIWRCDWRSISLFMSYISNSARCKYVWMDTACWNNLPLCISKLAPIKLQVPVNYLFPYELSFNYVTFILKMLSNISDRNYICFS